MSLKVGLTTLGIATALAVVVANAQAPKGPVATNLNFENIDDMASVTWLPDNKIVKRKLSPKGAEALVKNATPIDAHHMIFRYKGKTYLVKGTPTPAGKNTLGTDVNDDWYTDQHN